MSKQKHKIDFDLYKCFRVLANQVRFKIFIEILEEACECNLDEQGYVWGNCVTGIADKLQLGQPTVSNHVKELLSCGLVTSQKKGKNVYLFGNPEVAENFVNFSQFMHDEITGHE